MFPKNSRPRFRFSFSPCRPLALVAALAACSVLAPRPSAARAEDGAAITVNGVGEVFARPNRVEIQVQTSGTAELTSDAIVKYRSSEKAVTGAFEALGIAGLEIQPRTLSITSGIAGSNAMAGVVLGGPGGGPGAKSEFSVTRVLRISVKDIGKIPEPELVETIGRLLDTAKDTGAAVADPNENAALQMMMGRSMGASSPVSYIVEGADELREQAYRQAFAQAEARAQRLAKLSKTRLGAVLSVEEGPAATDAKGAQASLIEAVYGISTGAKDETRLASDKLGEIPVRVNLRVKFAIAPADKQ